MPLLKLLVGALDMRERQGDDIFQFRLAPFKGGFAVEKQTFVLRFHAQPNSCKQVLGVLLFGPGDRHLHLSLRKEDDGCDS